MNYLTLLLSLFAILGFTRPVSAETYLGLGGGLTIPFNATSVNESGVFAPGGGSTPITLTDLKVDKGSAYGAKAGYFFNQAPWFGLGVDYYSRTPKIGQQPVNIGGGGSGLFPVAGIGQMSVDFNYVRTLGFLGFARLPSSKDVNSFAYHWEPYIGAGLALNFASINNIRSFNSAGTFVSESSSKGSDVAVGPLVVLGINYKFNKNIKAFAESKFTRSGFTLSRMDGLLDTKFDYADVVFLFGASYGF